MSIVFLAAVGAIVVFVIVAYDLLTSLIQRSQASWSAMDTRLARRTDLVPNLVESAKGYAAHERDTLGAVVEARRATLSGRSEETRRSFKLDRPEERHVLTVSLRS